MKPELLSDYAHPVTVRELVTLLCDRVPCMWAEPYGWRVWTVIERFTASSDLRILSPGDGRLRIIPQGEHPVRLNEEGRKLLKGELGEDGDGKYGCGSRTKAPRPLAPTAGSEALPLLGPAGPRWEGNRLVHAKTPGVFNLLEGCEHGVPWDVFCAKCDADQKGSGQA